MLNYKLVAELRLRCQKNKSEDVPIKNENVKTEPKVRQMPAHPLLADDFTFPMARFHQQMNLMFYNMLSEMEALSGGNSRATFVCATPRMEALSKDGKFEVTAELTGVDKENVEVVIKDNTLTIKVEQKRKVENEADNYYLSESSFGSFVRTVMLPPNADLEKAESEFKNGVLKVTIPLKSVPVSNVRKLQINKIFHIGNF